MKSNSDTKPQGVTQYENNERTRIKKTKMFRRRTTLNSFYVCSLGLASLTYERKDGVSSTSPVQK